MSFNQLNTTKMKKDLLKKLSVLLVMLCISTAGYSQCVASYSSTNNGGGSYTFTNTGTNSMFTTANWYVNYALVGQGTNLTYSFPGNGSYNVCLEVSDSSFSCYDTICGTVNVSGMSGETGCYAYYTHSTNGNSVNLNVATSGAGFNPNAVTHISWDFGDGSTSVSGASYPSSFNNSHFYTSPGVYNICLTVYDSINMCSDSYCDSVNIAPASGGTGCVPFYNVNQGSNNNQISFNISSGNPLFDTTYISSIHWDFGDGTTSDGTMMSGPGPYVGNIMHTYAASGYYNVCLTTTDSVHGCSNTYCGQVAASNVTPTCSANFILWEDSTNAGTWYAYNYSTNFSSTVSYLWDFGDGTTSTQQFPTHTYAVSGHYDICLTVMDTLISCTSTYCDTSSVHRFSSTAGMMSFTVLQPGSATGIVQNNEVLTSVSVYPNPVTDNATLSLVSEE